MLTTDEFVNRYYDAGKAIEEAVERKIVKQGLKGAAASPVMLRTALLLDMAAHQALVSLLIEKNVFTQDEYFTILAEEVGKQAASMHPFLDHRPGTAESPK